MWLKASTPTPEKGVSCFPLPRSQDLGPPGGGHCPSRCLTAIPEEPGRGGSQRTRPGAASPTQLPTQLRGARRDPGPGSTVRCGSCHPGLGVSPLSLLPTHTQTVQGARLRHTHGSASANSQGRLLQQKVRSWHQTRSLHPHQHPSLRGDSQPRPRPHGSPPGGAGGHGRFPCPAPACQRPRQPAKAARPSTLPLPGAPRICLIEH